MPDQLDTVLHAQLGTTLDGTTWTRMAGRGPLRRYDGKVRDCYIDAGAGERIIVVTDRISAFDVVLGTIPSKGQVLNQLARYWFEETAHLAPNHLVAVPDANVMIGRECTPLPVELVMRGYLTGVTSTSVWRAYQRGDRVFCGHALPDGLRKNQPLPQAILTPSTKAAKGGHDVSVSREELLAGGAISARDFDRAAAIAATLFGFGQQRAAERGLILADTKYEMGIDGAGEIVVIDEIHTPDSSRYWFADDYQARLDAGQEPRSLDKEYLRRYLVEEAGYGGDGPPPPLPDHVRVEAARRYLASYQQLTGTALVPIAGDPVARIAAVLGAT